MITTAQRRLNSRVGGFVTASRHDPILYTTAARRAFRSSFAQAVDPDGSLPEAERERRATAAHKAHMARLSARSAAVRHARRRGVRT